MPTAKRKRKSPTAKRKPKTLVGYKQVAAAFGFHERTVQHWCSRGCPHSDTIPREFDRDAVAEWLELYRETESDSRSTSELRRQLLESKALVERLKAEKLQLSMDEARGNILPRDELVAAGRELIQTTRDRFMETPKRLARLVPKKYQSQLIQEGERFCKQILAELGTGFQRLNDEN